MAPPPPIIRLGSFPSCGGDSSVCWPIVVIGVVLMLLLPLFFPDEILLSKPNNWGTGDVAILPGRMRGDVVIIRGETGPTRELVEP